MVEEGDYASRIEKHLRFRVRSKYSNITYIAIESNMTAWIAYYGE